MSDWNVDDFSLEARLGDLEAILAATGLDRFALLGMSGGSAVAMAYAIAHPERVSRLVLYGTVCGEPVSGTPEEWAEEQTYRSMIRVGWAREDPEFRRVFTRKFIPDASEEQMRWFDDLQRMSTSPENAVASRIARQEVGHRRRAAADHRPDPRAPGARRPVDDLRQRRERLVTDRGRPARAAPEPEPHPARRRARLGGVHGGGVGVPRAGAPGLRRALAGPGGRGALSPRARRPPPGRRGPDERRDRRGPHAERPDRRAPPLEHLREARLGGRAARAAAVAGYLRGELA